MGDQPELVTTIVNGEEVTFAKPEPDTVTWEEVILWSYRPEFERCLDNPEYADYRARYATSRVARMFYDAEARYNKWKGIVRPANTWIAA